MFKGKDIISILDFTSESLYKVFDEAMEMERHVKSRVGLLEDMILALVFFEPSTRTMFSFQTAMYRLGGKCLNFSNVKGTSIAKGETLHDTIKMLDNYSNAIVIRHRIEGSAAYAADIAEAPVINAGDGSHHHPTQAIIDLYTIWREKRKLEGLNVGVLGDLKYGRASTSFIYGISLFKPSKIYLISPLELRIKDEVRDTLNNMHINYIETSDLNNVINDLDVLYVTRIQKERFPDLAEYERVKGSYQINKALLSDVKDGLMIMHPLPRVDEISYEVDETPYAFYFKEAGNAVPVRMALLKLILLGD